MIDPEVYFQGYIGNLEQRDGKWENSRTNSK